MGATRSLPTSLSGRRGRDHLATIEVPCRRRQARLVMSPRPGRFGHVRSTLTEMSCPLGRDGGVGTARSGPSGQGTVTGPAPGDNSGRGSNFQAFDGIRFSDRSTPVRRSSVAETAERPDPAGRRDPDAPRELGTAAGTELAACRKLAVLRWASPPSRPRPCADVLASVWPPPTPGGASSSTPVSRRPGTPCRSACRACRWSVAPSVAGPVMPLLWWYSWEESSRKSWSAQESSFCTVFSPRTLASWSAHPP